MGTMGGYTKEEQERCATVGHALCSALLHAAATASTRVDALGIENGALRTFVLLRAANFGAHGGTLEQARAAVLQLVEQYFDTFAPGAHAAAAQATVVTKQAKRAGGKH